METFETICFYGAAFILGVLTELVVAIVWFNYLLPWLKSRRVAIRGKDGRR